jgi:hypothetical protein
MLHRRPRRMLVPAVLVIGSALALATPRDAAAQVSIGSGVVIGGNQRPYFPPTGDRRGWYGRNSEYALAFNTGYADGYDKGRDDGRDRRVYDPMRHKRYRQADHQYQRGYGSKMEYQNAYREGFRTGYDAGYRQRNRYPNNDRRPSPWPRPY